LKNKKYISIFVNIYAGKTRVLSAKFYRFCKRRWFLIPEEDGAKRWGHEEMGSEEMGSNLD